MCLENWMKQIGLTMHLAELGVTPDMIEGIADATAILTGGYHAPKREEVVQILKESL